MRGSTTSIRPTCIHKGQSEVALGAALERSGKRDRFLLATKSPVWLVKAKDDWDRYLDEQLEKLKTDHIDFYLLHALSRDRWAKIKELGALPRPRAREGCRQDPPHRLLVPRFDRQLQGDNRRLR
jgi:predicted aldo/keto reductase-like oxidoreductase